MRQIKCELIDSRRGKYVVLGFQARFSFQLTVDLDMSEKRGIQTRIQVDPNKTSEIVKLQVHEILIEIVLRRRSLPEHPLSFMMVFSNLPRKIKLIRQRPSKIRECLLSR